MDYEQKYKKALERAKEQLKEAKVFDYKEGQIAHDIRTTTYAIFPELAESEDEKIKKGIIKFLKENKDFPEDWIAWLKKQGERKPDWNDYDMVVIDAIYNTHSHCGVTKCGCLEVTDMLEWLEELEKQGKRNNIVEQLTAFAQHLNKRGAFRDDLFMDFEHEAQSFIEFREYQNNKEL